VRYFVLALAAPIALALSASWSLPTAAQTSAARETAVTSSARDLLNSERIEAKFGSYGIEVLGSDERLRVSNLFSEEEGQRTTRTFAVVLYPGVVDPRFADEHRRILDGGSIGAVFTDSGWTVSKEHRYFGEVPSSRHVSDLMRVGSLQALAVHVYVLRIAKAGASFEYARLAEVHHPNYLRLQDLREAYGDPSAARPLDDPLVERILGETATAMR
jgi:hypothetical protein